MSGQVWRYRVCPACQHVAAASAFEVLSGPDIADAAWFADADRICPSCVHQAPTSEFHVVPTRAAEAQLERRDRWKRRVGIGYLHGWIPNTCTVHNRLLTYRESEANACSTCSPEVFGEVTEAIA